jgi:hypothetical protein
MIPQALKELSERSLNMSVLMSIPNLRSVPDMPSPFLYLLTIAIQVFETTIRVLGGLLSGHIFANQTGQPFYLPWYRGELLNLAHDLGKRLLPAFATPTGLPIARVSCARLCGGY